MPDVDSMDLDALRECYRCKLDLERSFAQDRIYRDQIEIDRSALRRRVRALELRVWELEAACGLPSRKPEPDPSDSLSALGDRWPDLAVDSVALEAAAAPGPRLLSPLEAATPCLCAVAASDSPSFADELAASLPDADIAGRVSSGTTTEAWSCPATLPSVDCLLDAALDSPGPDVSLLPLPRCLSRLGGSAGFPAL